MLWYHVKFSQTLNGYGAHLLIEESLNKSKRGSILKSIVNRRNNFSSLLNGLLHFFVFDVGNAYIHMWAIYGISTPSFIFCLSRFFLTNTIETQFLSALKNARSEYQRIINDVLNAYNLMSLLMMRLSTQVL